MRRNLLAEARRLGGVITREQARAVTRDHVIDDAVSCGALVRRFPGVYLAAEFVADEWCRLAAAIAYTGGALSHLDALAEWQLLPPEPHYRRAIGSPTHVTVPAGRGPTRCLHLVVHRRRDLGSGLPTVRWRRGLPVVALEQAVIDSWSMLPVTERRTPIIVALRDRRTTAERLHAVLAAQPRTSGAKEMRALITRVTDGCHSELEIYGHDRVLADKRLPRARSQVPIRLGNGVIYLDRYFEGEMLDVEFDGAAYHGSSDQRERDLERDSMLAALGIQVVRLTHQRLHRSPARVVATLLDILEVRRRQLGLRPVMS